MSPELTPVIEMSSNWILIPNVRCGIMKLLEDDKGENLNNLGFDDEFLDTTLKACSMGGKSISRTLLN